MLKIFLLSADPKENSKLNVDVEFNQIDQDILPKSKYKEDFSIKLIPAANYENLVDVLMINEDSIIHFSGHGVGEEGLVLVDKKGKKNILKTQKLTQLIDVLQSDNQHIKCVFLNGCYTEIQAEAISPYVEYVIGMSDEIFDDDAVKFAKFFYKGLFGKLSIEKSFKLGCISIGHDSMSIVDYDQNTKRAIYDPAPADQKASQPFINNKIPQLIINKKFKQLIYERNQVITYEQWKSLEKILLRIDFDLVKNIFIDTLRQDIKDIEREMPTIENLVDVKRFLLESYATHKDNDTLTILEFAERSTKEKDIPEKEKEEIQEWLEKIAEEKNINLPILPEETEDNVESSETLNSYLLISIIKNHEFSNFSLEAELIRDYQDYQDYLEEKTDKNPVIPISINIEGINDISPENLETKLSEIIDIAIDELPFYSDLTIELFVPYQYLGETFELYQVSMAEDIKEIKDTMPLGSQYQFAIRCLDRYTNKRLFKKYWRNWQDLSKTWIKNNLKNKLCLVDVINGISDEELEDYYCDFAMSCTPLFIGIRSDTKNLLDVNELDVNEKDSVEKIFPEILNIQSLSNLSPIFKVIYKKREEAYKKGEQAENYLGYNLGFICDHPDLIPSNLTNSLYGTQ